MNKICSHGIKLEKNIRCVNKGYCQVFLHHCGTTICKNFGPHTRESQQIAGIYLSEKRKEILQGKIGIAPELPSKRFAEVAGIWFDIWKKERNPDGTESHNKESCYKTAWTIKSVLIPVFGRTKFEEIRSVDIERWRCSYVKQGKSGTTANRYQAILSSIFAYVANWIQTEKIKPAFKVPHVLIDGKEHSSNPCDAVEMAPGKKRERILSKYEASKLKMAFMQLEDSDGWEICKLALKSVLSLKDLKGLEIGQSIDILRSKTSVPVSLPIMHLVKLNWYGWRTRWEKAREIAGLVAYKTIKNPKGQDVQIVDTSHPIVVEFRDLRKTGINWLKGRHELKLISEFAGHASIKTTEKAYTIKQAEYLEPLARDIESQVEAI